MGRLPILVIFGVLIHVAHSFPKGQYCRSSSLLETFLDFLYLDVEVVRQTRDSCENGITARAKHKILVRYASEVITTSSIEDCAAACKNKGNKCKSGMFYAQV